MAGENRTSADDLMDRLAAEPFVFDFFMALRRLENACPEVPRIGHSRRLADDPIRFGQEASLAFVPSALVKLLPRSGGPPRLMLSFFGLFGPNGPLPHHLTEYAREREKAAGDPTFARFVDVFHHRLASLFYRAWAVNNKAVQYERAGAAMLRPRASGTPRRPTTRPADPSRPDSSAEEYLEDDPGAPDLSADRFFTYITSLFGMGLPSLHARDHVPDVGKAHYAGRLVAQNRGAEGLAAIVGDYFGVPCSVQQFVGHWMRLPDDCRCRLGASRATGTLGSTCIAGSSIWESQQKFRIVIGPVSLSDYERMLPSVDGRGSLKRLVDWVSLYSGSELSWDMNLILKRAEVPQTRLGGFGRLGWTTWTRSRPHTRDADDLVLSPESLDLG